MRTRFTRTAGIGAVLAGFASAGGPGTAFPADRSVALTVYNQNLGVVKDVRTIELKRGVNEVRFTDVAAQIDPTSVHFSSVADPGRVRILEQNYQYDLAGAERILQKYVDQEITVVTKEDGKVFGGTLLSYDGGSLVLRTSGGDGITIVNRGEVKNLEFPKLPSGLITRPTLVWTLDSETSGGEACEVSYMTSGINWHAEYVAVTDEKDANLDFAGWVSIENNSGATYENAKLKLVAGDVHRAEERGGRPMMMKDLAVMEAAGAPAFEEKAFFEYHLYTLTRPATVADHETKQLSLFDPARTAVTKIFQLDATKNEKVVVALEFRNTKAAGLGMPLPKGKVRTYKRDSDGSLEFIGEDAIDHTAADEKVTIQLGNAFDVVPERTQTDFKQISRHVQEQAFQILLRNHKKENVTVKVVEHVYGDWKVLEASHKWTKKDAFTIEFEVPVTAGGEATVTYRVRIG
jgi:hypothetical protein